VGSLQINLSKKGRQDKRDRGVYTSRPGGRMARLKNKIALVSGAARGIGAAIARAFVDEGAWVLVTDIDEDLGPKTAAVLGDRAGWRRLDVREEADWIAATAEVLQRHGKLDILVNNAGITGFEAGAAVHDPEHASLEAWRAVHATNLDGTFLGCKAAIAAMRPAGTGSIINISSRSGLVGIPGAAAYASSKAAIRNHSKSVALWCAGQGLAIRCNSIPPAAILTPMWEPMLGEGPERAERMAAFVKDTPLQRFGTPEEVAAVAVMLASDEAAYLTGAEFNIDGGLLAGSAASPG
jgi:NAD(P)-dependent dehydrogenase (short-subunit alcohol dehydrogenase family)